MWTKRIFKFQLHERPESLQRPNVVQELQKLKSKLDSVEQKLQSVQNLSSPNEAEGETNLEWLKLTMTKAKNVPDRPRAKSDPIYG